MFLPVGAKANKTVLKSPLTPICQLFSSVINIHLKFYLHSLGIKQIHRIFRKITVRTPIVLASNEAEGSFAIVGPTSSAGSVVVGLSDSEASALWCAVAKRCAKHHGSQGRRRHIPTSLTQHPYEPVNLPFSRTNSSLQ